MTYHWTFGKDPLKLEKIVWVIHNKYDIINYSVTMDIPEKSIIAPGESCTHWLIMEGVRLPSLEISNCLSEAVVWRRSLKKVYSKISQNSIENTCARVSFLKLQSWGLQLY